MVMIIALAGCRASSGDDETPGSTTPGPTPTPTPTPETAPTIVSASPATNATGVSVSTSISVTFSTDMDASSINTNTFLVSNATGTVSYSNKTATFTPSGSLNATNTYTVTITTGVKSSGGIALITSHNWSFTTEGGSLSVLEVVAGDEHTCALMANGTVKCWGQNDSGQLGLGNTTVIGDELSEMGSNLASVALGTDLSALQIAAGSNHTCARLNNSSVKCWGQNDSGQLGRDSTDASGDEANEMGDNLTAINLGSGRTAIEITAGAKHTCARLDDGSVKCWGLNNYGQLGLGHTDASGDASGDMASLSAVNLGSVAVEVKAGWYHTCVRSAASSVLCWGRNEFGQLGIDSTADIGDATTDSFTAVNLGTGRTAVELTAGKAHTCARLDNGSVKCWGYNDAGQLGQENTDVFGDASGDMSGLSSIDLSDALGNARSAVKIAAGSNHTCAILDDGKVKCWGLNDWGQLGQRHESTIGDSFGDMGANLSYSDLGTGRTAHDIATGALHTCVRLDNGRIKCWGKNIYGQLGQGNILPHGSNQNEMGDNLTSIDVGTGAFAAVKLAVGYSHSCANLGFSSMKCWGKNDSGQLGQGHTNNLGDGSDEMGDYLSAIDVNGNVVEIAVGKNHSCALLDDGSVKCWGDNQYGQLGIDSIADIGDESSEMGSNLTSVNLGTGRTAMEIVTGGDHTCARLDNSSVKCWGYNEFGQLGQDSTNDVGDVAGDMAALSAINLGTDRTAVQVAAGENFTCARLDNGNVKCWGSNSNGQLGQGDTDRRGDSSGDMSLLTKIDLNDTGPISRTATQIVAGYKHVCALLDNSTVKCWGQNGEDSGKLGLGTIEENRGDGPSEMGENLPSVDLGTGRIAIQITAGSFHTCALLDYGSVKCWGQNEYGQLGIGNKDPKGTDPSEMGDALAVVNLGASAIELSAGYRHSCALLVNGKVKCWGLNQFGQLGLGDTDTRGDASGDMDNLPYVNLSSN